VKNFIKSVLLFILLGMGSIANASERASFYGSWWIDDCEAESPAVHYQNGVIYISDDDNLIISDVSLASKKDTLSKKFTWEAGFRKAKGPFFKNNNDKISTTFIKYYLFEGLDENLKKATLKVSMEVVSDKVVGGLLGGGVDAINKKNLDYLEWIKKGIEAKGSIPDMERNGLSLINTIDLIKCPEKKFEHSNIYTQSIFIINSIGEECYSFPQKCLSYTFNLIDITHDDKLSKAEISRMIRFVGIIEGIRYMPHSTKISNATTMASIGASALSPMVAQNIIDSYDYDGDGKLSMFELSYDRSTEDYSSLLDEISNSFSGKALVPIISSSFDKLTDVFLGTVFDD